DIWDWLKVKHPGFISYSNTKLFILGLQQGRTDNSWGPQAIGDNGAPVSLPTLKAHPKKTIKCTGISWGPLLIPGPQAVPECPN
ncbi:unnamed protein product, partial [Staurois parvus]